MGKKRAAADAPVFPFPAVADHFSDYGFDPQLVVHFLSQQTQSETTKRLSARRHHHQPPPLESARFQLEKPISSSNKKHRTKQQHRRRWWSSAALFLFKRQPSSSSSANPTAAGAVRPGPATASLATGPLYLTDVDDDSSCACWAPSVAMRSAGHLQLAAAELGVASAASVPYVSLRNADCSIGPGAAPPAMPIYLVT